MKKRILCSMIVISILFSLSPIIANALPNISAVEITIDKPETKKSLDTSAICNTDGVKTCEVQWVPNDSVAKAGQIYKAIFTLESNSAYRFNEKATAKVNGFSATQVSVDPYKELLIVTMEFPETTQITPALIPAQNTAFQNYYGYDGYRDILINGKNRELDSTVSLSLENDYKPDLDIDWSIANENGEGYDKTPGATNIFKGIIDVKQIEDYEEYNWSSVTGYNNDDKTIECKVSVKNKAATTPDIKGIDSTINYTGMDVNVAELFEFDSDAKNATFSLINENDVTGEGTLDGSMLNVEKTGIFKIKMMTTANGIYAAGEKIVTLTVNKGTIQYTAADYSGIYDGDSHSINVSVVNPTDARVTYSTDGIDYTDNNPNFIEQGTYTVYYKITKDNYETILGSTVVTIKEKFLPEIINGKGQTVKAGETKELSFRSNASFADFKHVEVDGKEISEDKYTVKEGSIIVTLKEEYLSTLTSGKHTISIVSESGEASADFTIQEAEVSGSDENKTDVIAKTDDENKTDVITKADVENKMNETTKTGDNTNVMLYVGLAAVAFAACVIVLQTKKHCKIMK